jgi:predicted nicotinamide N-methyase
MERPNTSDSPPSSTTRKLDKNKLWTKLKNILFSNEKLKFLNCFNSIELNLFEKQNVIENEKCIKIIYKGLNNNYKDQIQNFQQVEIIKPLDELISQSLNNENSNEDILDFYSEKVDNTGNVQIWPSEETLAIYCLLNKNLFENKNIIELGSGYSGLCGLIIAKNIPKINEICITDGNSKCIEGVRNNIKINFPISQYENEYDYLKSKIKEKVLLWDRRLLNYDFSDNYKFDIILLSDCLFFKNYHIDLVYTLDFLLSEKGTCYFVAPPRGKTLDSFIQIASEKFLVEKSQSQLKEIIINSKIQSKSSFQPYLIKLQRK